MRGTWSWKGPGARARVVWAALLAVAGSLVVGGPPAAAGTCRPPTQVPGAEQLRTACLGDLTTAGTVGSGHTNPADWAGLHPAGAVNPRGVPGVQLDGYFPDSSTTNTNNGWNHDAQFVIRLPDRWNGKLVVSGAPGNRRQYANDFIIADWALARGYAFAATDKGNTGATFYRDGARPGDAVLEWHRRMGELTRATKRIVRRHYGARLRRTYLAGISNGGYLVRFALENEPHLYDGGVDWEGTLFRAQGPNLLTFLPPALRNYPAYRDTGSQAAHDAIIAAGFAPGSEFLWDLHHRIYWDLTQRIYREEFDPGYDGPLEAGTPFCAPGTPACDADYRYASRPRGVKDAVARVSNTGRLGRRMITLHGTLDTLLPIRVQSDVYRRLVRRAGRARLHRYYRIEGGNHVDAFYDQFPDRLRPMLPCFRAAFVALEGWVEDGDRPGRRRLVRRPDGGDLANECEVGGSAYDATP